MLKVPDSTPYDPTLPEEAAWEAAVQPVGALDGTWTELQAGAPPLPKVHPTRMHLFFCPEHPLPRPCP